MGKKTNMYPSRVLWDARKAIGRVSPDGKVAKANEWQKLVERPVIDAIATARLEGKVEGLSFARELLSGYEDSDLDEDLQEIIDEIGRTLALLKVFEGK
jgi:hypothetical protein